MKGTKYVNMGNQIHLLCNASGISRAPEEIDWFFEGNRIHPSNPRWNGRVEILKHTSIPGRYYISELLIEQSSMADQGSYVCRSSDLNVNSMKVHVLNGEYFYNTMLNFGITLHLHGIYQYTTYKLNEYDGNYVKWWQIKPLQNPWNWFNFYHQ